MGCSRDKIESVIEDSESDENIPKDNADDR